MGFKYDNPAYWLKRFDQFCTYKGVTEPEITKELYDEWSNRFDTETKTTQNNRLQAVKGFSNYLNARGICSYIPLQLPKPEKNIPYLMSCLLYTSPSPRDTR